MAPEIFEGKQYDGKLVDLFSLGTLLFVMVKGAALFRTAEITKDPYFKALSAGKHQSFWNVHSTEK